MPASLLWKSNLHQKRISIHTLCRLCTTVKVTSLTLKNDYLMKYSCGVLALLYKVLLQCTKSKIWLWDLNKAGLSITNCLLRNQICTATLKANIINIYRTAACLNPSVIVWTTQLLSNGFCVKPTLVANDASFYIRYISKRNEVRDIVDCIAKEALLLGKPLYLLLVTLVFKINTYRASDDFYNLITNSWLIEYWNIALYLNIIAHKRGAIFP